MVKDLSVDMAALIGCWSTTLLYGVNLVLFPCCLFVLVFKRKGSALNWILICTSTLQFLLATAHVSCVLRALVEGFVWAGRSETIIMYWFDMSLPVHVAQEALYIANSVIGDAIMVWRLWVLWPGKPWICIFPAIIVVLTAVCGIIAEVRLAHLNPTDPLFLKAVLQWITATWSLSITLQTSCTALIAYKILSTTREIQNGLGLRFGKSNTAVVWIVVESGALYSMSTLVLLTLFVLNTQAGAVIGDSLGQLSAIFPTLIIVRVGLGLSHAPEAIRSFRSAGSSSTQRTRVEPAQVNITRRKGDDFQLRMGRNESGIDLSPANKNFYDEFSAQYTA